MTSQMAFVCVLNSKEHQRVLVIADGRGGNWFECGRPTVASPAGVQGG